MKLLIQRIGGLKIYKDKEEILNISKDDFCFLIYVGIEKNDQMKNFQELVEEIENLQIIEKKGKFSQKLKEMRVKIVLVSNVTLLANFHKGRINFNRNLEFDKAKELFQKFAMVWKNFGRDVFIIPFGSFLEIKGVNIGPINFYLEL